MALIADPDFLNQGTEVVFDTSAKTIQLLKAGNLSDDGVTLQALYSFTKEEWKNDSALIKFPFPFIGITPESFEFVSGWTPADATTVNLIRNAGFAIKNSDGTSAEEYAGVITLGELGASDQVYYQQVADGSPIDVVLTGPVNQAIKVYGDASNGDFDVRGYLQLFVREQAKKYAQADLVDIGVGTMTYQAYRFPLANYDDLKITHSDATADSYGITITYQASPATRTINGVDHEFNVVIDGQGAFTLEEIYEGVQSALRKNSDIDAGAGTVVGKTTDELLSFVGDTLVTNQGVVIDNFLGVDTNRQELYDINGTKVLYPYVAAGIISFNDNLVNDGQAVFTMFYEGDFDSTSADIVEDADGNPIQGAVPPAGFVSYSYDYDGDTGGGGASIDKSIRVVAIGLDGAAYVAATGTITRTTSNSISLVSALERNYDNA